MVTHLLILLAAATLALALLACVLSVPGSPPPVNPPPPPPRTLPMPARLHAEDAVTDEVAADPVLLRQLALARQRERLVRAAGYAESAQRLTTSAESAEGDDPTA